MYKIAVEGFDGAGKSTLVKELSALLNQPAFHNTGPPANDADIVVCSTTQYTRLHGWPSQISDRLTCISTPCYSSSLTEQDRRWLMFSASVTLQGVNLIWCIPSEYQAIHDNKGDTPEYVEYMAKNREVIIEKYHEYMSWINRTIPFCNLIIWNFQDGRPASALLEELEYHINVPVGTRPQISH